MSDTKKGTVELEVEECIATMKLVGQKIQRCDYVMNNSNDETHKAQAKRSLKKFRPVFQKLGELYEELK